MSASYSVAFIGLGTMGYPMAGHLLRGGHRVAVYNRNTAKAQTWMDEYAPTAPDNLNTRLAKTPKEAVQGADFVMLCVGNDNDVKQVVLSADGALAGMTAGAVLIDHTTTSVNLAQVLGQVCAEKDVGFIDAPVSGGQSGAQKGILTMMCGADSSVFELAQPILQCYARVVTHMGPIGSGQLTKMVNQICIAGLVQGLSEALAFGQKAGLDMERALEVISNGAAQSWQMENRGTTMLANKFDFGFAVNWMRKDLGLVKEQAKQIDAQLPVTELVDSFYAELQASGGGLCDTSSLIKRLVKPS